MDLERCHTYCICPTPLAAVGHEQRSLGYGKHSCVYYNVTAHVEIMGVDVSHHLDVKGGNKIDEE